MMIQGRKKKEKNKKLMDLLLDFGLLVLYFDMIEFENITQVLGLWTMSFFSIRYKFSLIKSFHR